MAAIAVRSAVFWAAARELDPDVDDKSHLPGVREGHLAALFDAAGLRDIEDSSLSVSLEHQSFESWWEPFIGGVGPAGSYVVGLEPDAQDALRELCRSMLPPAPFVVTADAWVARGRIRGPSTPSADRILRSDPIPEGETR